MKLALKYVGGSLQLEVSEMTLGILFWVVYIISTLFGGWYWRAQPWLPGISVGWVLIGVLGWAVFGPAIK
jgi:hypothetical protein